MGAGIPTPRNIEQISQSLSVLVSTESATILANAFRNPVTDWGVLVSAIASALASFFAFLAIRQNKITQREQLIQNIHNQFFEINRDWANRQAFTSHDYELLANFMDRVAELVEKNKLTLDEVSSFRSLTAENDFIDFVKDYRKKNGKNYYKSLSRLIKIWA